MSLAGKYYLHRPPAVVDDPGQACHILQKQCGPLIRGKTPGKAQGEDGRVQQHPGGHDVVGIGALPPPLKSGPLSYLGYKHLLHEAMVLPYDPVRDLVHQLPDVRMVMLLQPGPSQIAIEYLITEAPIDPGGNMHPVSDMLNGNLI